MRFASLCITTIKGIDMSTDLKLRYQRAMERFTKWRRVFAAWQTGNLSDNGPEAAAIRDHREVTMVLRAEVNALAGLLIKKGVFTSEEFTEQIIEEAGHLTKAYEGLFPGFKVDNLGLNITVPECLETIKKWER